MGAGGSGMSPHGMSRAVRWWLACLGLIAAIASASPASDQQQTTAPALASLTSSTPQQLERQGDELRAQKRFLDSIDYYNAAIAQQPTALLWNKKGIALLFLTHKKEAQKCFQEALRIDKNSTESVHNLGFVEQSQKNYGKAIKYYNKALARSEERRVGKECRSRRAPDH